jgi:hypothetical protein
MHPQVLSEKVMCSRVAAARTDPVHHPVCAETEADRRSFPHPILPFKAMASPLSATYSTVSYFQFSGDFY